MKLRNISWLVLRLMMGFIFLWAFLDKLLGLGFSTKAANAWLKGGSPTAGYLLNATHGPFATFFQGLAGVAGIDWLFMAGLLGVGLSLLLNKYLYWGAIAGSIMLFLMWLSAFPPANNPLVDDHLIYILVLAVLAMRSKE